MRPTYEALTALAAIACVPAGFLLPRTRGLKDHEVWLVAIGIWIAGVLIAAAVPKSGSWSNERSIVLWTNGVLAALAVLRLLHPRWNCRASKGSGAGKVASFLRV
jgi:predicted lysophospholipase L1 biosynthesis ABC-type transport system permease subunit